jgi:CubicO group peptidase (beta-lactamase class C family)
MPATPEDVGLSSAGLEFAREYVAGCIAQGQIAGAVLSVSRHDEIAQLACLGLRDIEAGRPMEPNTIFRIASMTKPIVSSGALMLVEAGKLSLDDPLSGYVPEFAEATVFDGVEGDRVKLAALERPITVYDLLVNMSGLAEVAPHPALELAYDDLGEYRYGLQELMRRLAAHPLAHQPGRGWTYGWSYEVLGRVIEVASGHPLDEYLDSAIFRPLGMGDSGFHVPSEKLERLAVVYEQVEGGLRRSEDPATNEVIEHFPLLSGGGGCVSSVLDYQRFIRMLQRRGELDGVRVLRPDTVELMTRNHLAAPHLPIRIGTQVSSAGDGYGLGVGVKVESSVTGLAGSQGTYAWAGSWNSWFWIDPVKDLSAIFMVQYEPFEFEGIGGEFWSRVCGSLVDRGVRR